MKLIALLLACLPAFAQISVYPPSTGSGIGIFGTNIIGAGPTQLPAAASSTGQLRIVTDASAVWDCTAGGGTSVALCRSNGATWTSLAANPGGGGSMVYPGGGVPNSTGAAWGTSYAVGTSANNLVQLNGTAQLPAVSAALLTNFPTLNQNTSGTAASATNVSGTVAVANGGTGRTSLTIHGVLLGATTAAITQLAAAGSDTVLMGSTAADPSFVSVTNCGDGSHALAYSTSTHTFSCQAMTAISMTYPGAGVPLSTGTAWGTSYAVGTGANNLVQLNASAQLPAMSAALLTNFPTLNQNTTGSAATATNITGTAAVGNGGTGRSTLTNHGVLLGASAAAITQLAVAANDTVFMGSTGVDPAFVAVANCGDGTHALSYNTSTHAFGCQAISAGTGTVSVVSSGALTSTAFVTGGGTTLTQTASATSTLDASGNAVFAGTVTAGAAGGAGATMTAPEGTTATAAAGQDVCYADATAHAMKCSWNNGTFYALSRTVSSGATALGTGAISSAACATVVTATATGVVATDVVTASFNSDPTGVTGYVPLTAGMLTIVAYPGVDSANFKVCNNTSSSITPGAITLNWRISR